MLILISMVILTRVLRPPTDLCSYPLLCILPINLLIFLAFSGFRGLLEFCLGFPRYVHTSGPDVRYCMMLFVLVVIE